MSVVVHHGDSREVLKGFADESIDSVVCDPPYALTQNKKGGSGVASVNLNTPAGRARITAGFMGKAWDTGETAFDPMFWFEVLRILKPGGHLLAFGGTRTYHRLACAIEDSGFEIRDMVSWLYGAGFPKSLNVSKAIDRSVGADPIDTGETKRASIQRNGEGAAWDAGAFASHPEDTKVVSITRAATPEAQQWEGWGTALKPACEPIVMARKPINGTVAANVLKHGTGALNIDSCRVGWQSEADAAAAATPAGGFADSRANGTAKQSVSIGKDSRDGANTYDPAAISGRWPANVIHDGSDEVVSAFPVPIGDDGSAARFFYSSKADADDRCGSKHPTVKPTDLMAYLVRLVTPPGGVVLDPFAGSGSTGMACLREGFDCVLIEREAEYIADINRRIAHVEGLDAPLFSGVAQPASQPSRTNNRSDRLETVSA